MIKLDNEKEVVLRRLANQVRMTTAGLEKLKRTDERADYRETVKGLYKRTQEFFKDFPELELEFKLISPIEPGRGNPDTFPAVMLILRGFLDSVEDTLNFQDKTKISNEFLITDGQAFTASRIIGNVLKTASNSIKIVDNYLSTDSVVMLEKANSKVQFRILTKGEGNKYSGFLQALKIMKSGWKGQLELRITKNLHDRYLIIDDADLWHCGPSLDYLGKKVGVISKFEDPEVINGIINIFNKEWLAGTIVLLNQP